MLKKKEERDPAANLVRLIGLEEEAGVADESWLERKRKEGDDDTLYHFSIPPEVIQYFKNLKIRASLFSTIIFIQEFITSIPSNLIFSVVVKYT